MKEQYLEFDEEMIKQIEEITDTDYNFQNCKIIVEDCLGIIKDLIFEYENLQEEYNDFKLEVEENYERKYDERWSDDL